MYSKGHIFMRHLSEPLWWSDRYPTKYEKTEPEINPKRLCPRTTVDPFINRETYSPLFSDVVVGADVGVGRGIEPNSDPPPLWPRLRPGMWNPKEVDDLEPDDGASLEESPKRAKRPFFLGLASSFRPTSSKTSSSMASALSKLVERSAGDVIREKRESSEVRDGRASGCVTGERAEIS